MNYFIVKIDEQNECVIKTLMLITPWIAEHVGGVVQVVVQAESLSQAEEIALQVFKDEYHK